MGNLDLVFKNLLERGYSQVQAYQLLFLYNFYKEKQRDEEFNEFLNLINTNYEAETLEQIIKCIVHNTPYRLFIGHEDLNIDVVSEIRRYLEGCKKFTSEIERRKLYYIAKKIIDYDWNANVIYQFRRFLKLDCITCEEIEYLFELVMQNKIEHWTILNSFYTIYTEYSFAELKRFVNSDAIKNLLIEYVKYKNSKEQQKLDRALVYIFSYANNWSKK